MKKINKLCSFYANNWHLIVKILPFICKQMMKEKIIVISQENLQEEVKQILERLNIKQEIKEKIIKLNWNKEENMENNLKNICENANIIVVGNKDYIENVNCKIEGLNKTETIINCFEIMQFNKHIEEILYKHDKVLNTSGIEDIEEFFESYNKEIV